jgi:two-component system, NarL family, response regulator NreC
MIKVLLVDDQPTVLQGLRMRLGLEPDLVVVGEAEDGQAAIDLVSARSPDVIVLDLEMPGMDGIATAQALHAIAPEGKLIILSIHSDAAARKRALAAGAVAFVEKNAGIEPLLAAIRRGRAGTSSTSQE